LVGCHLLVVQVQALEQARGLVQVQALVRGQEPGQQVVVEVQEQGQQELGQGACWLGQGCSRKTLQG